MKKLLFIAAILVTLFYVSCNDKNDDRNDDLGGTASLIVSVKGKPATKSIGSSDNPTLESTISNFHVFVFHYNNGYLEKHASFNGANTVETVTGLSTGNDKTVVAFVNVPSTMDLDNIVTYSDLQSKMLDLDSQNGTDLGTTGLFMSGKTTDPLTLIANTNNTVEIPVTRRVAKVVLKNLIISPDASSTLSDFTLNGVSIQKARVFTTPIDTVTSPTGDINVNFAGGIASPSGAIPNFTLVKSYLLDTISVPQGYVAGNEIISSQTKERYYYVFPNNGKEYATLLTLSGTYGSNDTIYYPFEINNTTGAGNTTGKYIESNIIYELSVTLKRLNNPSTDPNQVPSNVSLEVTVTPKPWETTINQPVEW